MINPQPVVLERPWHSSRAADRGAPRRPRGRRRGREAVGTVVHLGAGSRCHGGLRRGRAEGSARRSNAAVGGSRSRQRHDRRHHALPRHRSPRSIEWKSATRGSASSRQRTGVNTTCKLLLLGHAFETLQCKVVGFEDGQLQFPFTARESKASARRRTESFAITRRAGRHRARLGDVQHPRRGVAGRQETPGTPLRTTRDVRLSRTLPKCTSNRQRSGMTLFFVSSVSCVSCRFALFVCFVVIVFCGLRASAVFYSTCTTRSSSCVLRVLRAFVVKADP